MNVIHKLYVRIACTVGAITTGLTIGVHNHHGLEHLWCIALGIALGLFGMFGFPSRRKVDVTNDQNDRLVDRKPGSRLVTK